MNHCGSGGAAVNDELGFGVIGLSASITTGLYSEVSKCIKGNVAPQPIRCHELQECWTYVPGSNRKRLYAHALCRDLTKYSWI
jgi:hypothetical protein